MQICAHLSPSNGFPHSHLLSYANDLPLSLTLPRFHKRARAKGTYITTDIPSSCGILVYRDLTSIEEKLRWSGTSSVKIYV